MEISTTEIISERGDNEIQNENIRLSTSNGNVEEKKAKLKWFYARIIIKILEGKKKRKASSSSDLHMSVKLDSGAWTRWRWNKILFVALLNTVE